MYQTLLMALQLIPPLLKFLATPLTRRFSILFSFLQLQEFFPIFAITTFELLENAKIRLARALQVGNILKDDKSTLFNNQMRLKQLQTDQANLNNVYNQVCNYCDDV